MTFSRARVAPVLLLALAGAGVVALQSPAEAAITTTTITSPVDGSKYLIDDTNSDPIPTVTLTGTSDGTTGDLVDIRCFGVSGSRDYAPGPSAVPVQADGSFSVEMPINSAYAACRLRAVPDSLGSGDSLAAFSGPTITTEYALSSKVASGPNAGMTYDLNVLYQGSKAFNQFYSAGRGGLYGDRLSYAGGTSGNYLWAGAAALPARSGAIQSAVRIDGKDAFSPNTAQEVMGFVDRAGAPALTYDAQRDAGTGVVTVHEIDPYVVCPAPTVYPPPSEDCQQFETAGVQLERTYTTSDEDRQVHVRDVWRSTDGKAHSISAVYLENVNGYDYVTGDVTQVGLKFRWSGSFDQYPGSPTTYAGPTQLPNSVLVRESNTAPDGDLYVPRGAVSFDFPAKVEWEQNGVVNLQAKTFKVPAGGSLLMRQSFVIGSTDAEVLAKAKANQTRINPYRPDAWIKPSGGTFKGNNIYSTSGAGQTVGGTTTYVIAVQNDGTRTDSFRIRGGASMHGFAVKYLAGGTGNTSITYAVTHGTYALRYLVPGERRYLRLVVTLPSTANGQVATFPISETSLGNTYVKDVVKAVLQMAIS
jgi:hypothetical protein